MSINKVDKEIAELLKEWKVDCGIGLRQVNHMKDDWQSDKWVVSFNEHDFEYYTGIGHRIAKNNYTFTQADERTIKKLKDIWGLERMPHLMKATGDKVLRRGGGKTISDLRETYTVPPTQANVLYCLLLDAAAHMYTFQEWCNEYGYDTDSRKALDMYMECQATHDKLRDIFTYEQEDKLRSLLEDY